MPNNADAKSRRREADEAAPSFTDNTSDEDTPPLVDSDDVAPVLKQADSRDDDDETKENWEHPHVDSALPCSEVKGDEARENCVTTTAEKRRVATGKGAPKKFKLRSRSEVAWSPSRRIWVCLLLCVVGHLALGLKLARSGKPPHPGSSCHVQGSGTQQLREIIV